MTADIYCVLIHRSEISSLHWESLYLQSDTLGAFPKQKNQAVWDTDVLKHRGVSYPRTSLSGPHFTSNGPHFPVAHSSLQNGPQRNGSHSTDLWLVARPSEHETEAICHHPGHFSATYLRKLQEGFGCSVLVIAEPVFRSYQEEAASSWSTWNWRCRCKQTLKALKDQTATAPHSPQDKMWR